MSDRLAERSDAEQVAEARAGRESAKSTLIGRHHAACLRYARHLLGDERDAEDAVQETFMRAFAALGRYEERDTFRAWIFRILINRCRTLAGRRSRQRQQFVNDEAAIERASAPGPEAWVELRHQLVRALAGLDTAHREAFLLRVGEEMEYDEMARLTGVGEGALRMRVKRARDHVRAHWPAGGTDART